MTDRPDPTDLREQRLDEAALAFLNAREAGASQDPSSWLRGYPDLAADLDEFRQAVERIETLAAPLRAAAATAAGHGDATAAYTPGDRAGGPGLEDRPGEWPPGYEVLKELGHGGMGVVYLAWDTDLKRYVALKMIRGDALAGPEEVARFLREAEAVAAMHHPNIVQIFASGKKAGRPYFAMELADGGSLDDLLGGTPLPAKEAAVLLASLARAVQHAHDRGVIHRDLKPANVLLQGGSGRAPTDVDRPERRTEETVHDRLRSSVAKLTDFGLAKRLDAGEGATASGAIVGTPGYMAPEQAQGGAVDRPADVYGLGAVLYALLTGRPPFRAASFVDTLAQVIHTEPAPPRVLNPKVPRDLETICLRCLHKDPARRFPSASELADDLGRFLNGEPIQSRPVGAPERLWRWCRRHPARAAVAAVALAGLLAVLGVGFWFNHLLRGQLAETEQARKELQMALTKQVAEKLDSDLRQLGGIPQMMAATLEERGDWADEQLLDWMGAALEKDRRVDGTCLAFEDPARDTALYVFRQTKVQNEAIPLRPPKYPYREKPWYTRPRQERRASWSEPFFDEGATGDPMVTYSVPWRREGAFAGVVTVDLKLAYFRQLRRRLDELNLGQGGYAFVVSPQGTFISHPNEEYPIKKKITEADGYRAGEPLGELPARLLRQEIGSVQATDPHTGKPSVFCFAPVPSAGWSFVVVVPDPGAP